MSERRQLKPQALVPAPRGPVPEKAVDPYEGDTLAEALDHSLRASVGRLTGGLSPHALASAYLDWASHLAASPGKQLHLWDRGLRKAHRLAAYLMQRATDPSCAECISPLPQDKRFAHEAWRRFPYDAIAQNFLLWQQWWHNATTGVRGVDPHHERVVEFAARQWLDVIAPSNFFWTNPEVIDATIAEGGANLVRGWTNFVDDWRRAATGRAEVHADQFVVGRDLAATPGRVVFRNHLIELIQYTPTTPKVRPEPVLITPAWIMKYYILDLAPGRSLVRHLVDSGFSVFIISWRNPDAADRDLSFDAYRTDGVMAALDAIGKTVPGRKVHAMGYCLGGTLLSIAAATMARSGDHRLASLSLLAAQIDFAEAGELTLFIDESQVSFLEDLMWRQGYLDTTQMAGAFALLRSNDLVWSKLQRDYWLGRRDDPLDIMAWNADATRMPYRMHADYLRRLFLDNAFSKDRFEVDGSPVQFRDIRCPIFALGATRDHVAPWTSVFKVHGVAEVEVTFALTEGGHNGGVVSPPGHARGFKIARMEPDTHVPTPETWAREIAQPRPGSWWTAWAEWLHARSGAPVEAPALGPSLADAPGTYVFQK